MCKGIPEEEQWRKQEDVVGRAISVSRKQQERTVGWVVHGEPLVIRTGTFSERWTLIRGKGCFGLWRGQGSSAESGCEVTRERKSAGLGTRKAPESGPRLGSSAHRWGRAVRLRENVYCQINSLELWRPSPSSPSSLQSLFVDAGTY